MKNVLVTGANGFVGNHLVKELADNGMSVTAIGGRTGTSEPSPYVRSSITVDLTDPDAAHTIDFSNIDAVIHLAGLAAVGPSFDAPLEYITANAGMEINLFEAALAQDAHPRFVVISTGALYDPKATLPLSETSHVEPSSPYAVSKIAQEQMALYYGRRGFDVIIARPFNHIGPGQNPGFIVPDLAQQIVAVQQGKADTLHVGNLDAQRDYTDVRDIARAYRLLAEHGKGGETYNICSGTALSGHAILEQLLAASGINPPIETDPAKMRPADTAVIYGNHSKITADTDWQPTIDLKTTFADVIADWQGRN